MCKVIALPAERLGAVDIVMLCPHEQAAALVHLAGHQDATVAQAVTDAVREVLARTRSGSWRWPGGGSADGA